MTEKWMPISTAPVASANEVPSYYRFKCLLAQNGRVFQGYAEYTLKQKKLAWRDATLNGTTCAPTHWMPIPEPPYD